MKPEDLKGKVIKGVLWGGLNQVILQLLSMVIGIFLARLLTPEDYGMVGVLAVFSGLAGALQEGGFISALTNRKNISPLDYNSVFWFSLTLGLIFYIILFFLAPLISRFYDLPELVSLSRFVFLGFLFSCVGIVPRAIFFKNMRLKETAIVTLFSMIFSGTIGILLSIYGYAYWGLAWQNVTFIFCSSFGAYIMTKWHPSFKYSFTPIKEMLGYSFKLVITNVFNIINNNIFAVLLGKFYSPSDVGDYNQANKWNTMGYSLIVGVMGGVAQPALATVVDDPDRQSLVFRKMLRFTVFVSFPLMFGLSLVAPEFIVIMIGVKWLFSAFILQALCIWGAVYPISHLFSNLLLSQGRSTSFMWITIVLAVIQMLAVFFTYPYGIFRMIYVFITINVLGTGIWFWAAKKRLPLNFFNMIKDILPFALIGGAACFISYFVCRGIDNLFALLFAKLGVMLAIYLVLLWILDAKILKESIEFISKKLRKAVK